MDAQVAGRDRVIEPHSHGLELATGKQPLTRSSLSRHLSLEPGGGGAAQPGGPLIAMF